MVPSGPFPAREGPGGQGESWRARGGRDWEGEWGEERWGLQEGLWAAGGCLFRNTLHPGTSSSVHSTWNDSLPSGSSPSSSLFTLRHLPPVNQFPATPENFSHTPGPSVLLNGTLHPQPFIFCTVFSLVDLKIPLLWEIANNTKVEKIVHIFTVYSIFILPLTGNSCHQTLAPLVSSKP